MLRLMIKKYNIDENRVYIEGISNGGHGMYEALKRAPWLFAAAIGMSPIDDGFVNIQGMAPAIAHIPLWIFQGGFDQTPYPSKTRRYVQQFRAAGADVRLTLYPELGHGTWNTAFKEPDFFTWMLGKNKTDIHSFEKSKVICSEEGTKLEVGPGFKAYQWQFNGTTIAGADSSVYFAKAPGSYKVRFARVENPTEGQWTGWSDAIALAVEPPPQANIHQIGSVLLRDLNDNKNAVLEASEDHAHYYWYKNGHLVDTPSNEDDTLKTVIIDPSFGKGAYTLAVADFGCKSDPSAAKNIIFGNAAPITIASPSEFDGISLSPSENSLVWKDNSADEGGFEIWRKRKISNAQFSPWEMATITGPNVVMYTDTALIPQSEYFYKIRAVSSTARSEYVPAPENDALAVQTAVDNELPTAPAALKAQVKGVQSFLLSWKPSNDNTRIRQYYIYLNDDSVVTPTPDTSFMLTNVPLNKNYEIAVRGVDLSGNPSTPSNIVKVTTYFSGLYYEHSTGTWTDLDSIDWTLAEFTGTVRTFTLAPKTQDDYFNFRFDGFLYIENGGNYEFRTSSDDGSRLKLNNQLVVDNDGMHALRTVASARVNLSTGAQRITAEFFDYTESDSLLVEYKGADTGEQWAVIPRDALKSDESVMALGPDNGPEDSFIVSVYPNPATQDNIHVQVETLAREPVLVRLIDPIGKNLFEGAFDADEISHGISISTPGAVQTGLYVIAVDQGKTRVRKKLIIKR
jgi:hypothetical protein